MFALVVFVLILASGVAEAPTPTSKPYDPEIAGGAKLEAGLEAVVIIQTLGAGAAGASAIGKAGAKRIATKRLKTQLERAIEEKVPAHWVK